MKMAPKHPTLFFLVGLNISITATSIVSPFCLAIGITAHHLIVNNSVTSSLEMYEKLMEDELVPLLKQSLTTHPHQEIIWLRQSLTIEQLSPHENQVAYGIYPDKIKKYNAILPRVFK
jgi:hypothetical protein